MLRHILRKTKIFNFNVVNRDLWVKAQARLLPPGTKVLDVGAGSCPYRQWFSHVKYFSQDFQQLSGEQLRHGGYGRIDYVSDATKIPVADSSFDVVLCTEVMEHVIEPTALLSEIGRILKPGGKLLLTAPLGSGLHQEPFHFYGGFTKHWYRHFLPLAGFDLIEIGENGGSFSFFAQESIRFLRASSPINLPAPTWVKFLVVPAWLLIAPVLGCVAPLYAHLLDRFDTDKKFTVGYHVVAEKRQL